MILVTGGTGFLGSQLIKILVDSGKSVRALKRENSDTSALEDYADRVEWIDGDLLDIFSLEDALQDIKQVYHCAAVVSFNPSDRKDLFEINIKGTEHLVNCCLSSGIEKLVHVSSIAALGRTKEESSISEETKWVDDKLNSSYAISKYFGENEVWRGITEGLNAVIVNPSVILGPWDWSKGTAKFFPMTWKGLKYYTSGTTGFVDVEDVAKCMIQLMKCDISGERYIISSDNWKFQKLFGKIADQLGKKQPSKKANPVMAGLAWRLEYLRSKIFGVKPIITEESVAIGMVDFYYDNNKIKEQTGFRFKDLEETIAHTSTVFINSLGNHK